MASCEVNCLNLDDKHLASLETSQGADIANIGLLSIMKQRYLLSLRDVHIFTGRNPCMSLAPMDAFESASHLSQIPQFKNGEENGSDYMLDKHSPASVHG